MDLSLVRNCRLKDDDKECAFDENGAAVGFPLSALVVQEHRVDEVQYELLAPAYAAEVGVFGVPTPAAAVGVVR